MTPDEKVALINDGVRVMLRHGNTADAVEAIVDMVLDEVKTDATIYEALAERGITRERLQKVMDSGDSWGGMVNAVEYLSVLNGVLRSWPKVGA